MRETTAPAFPLSRPRLIAVTLALLWSTLLVAGALGAPHAHAGRRAKSVPPLAPALRRMMADELGPGWPYARGTAARQLERALELEREAEQAGDARRFAAPASTVSAFSTTPGLAADGLVNSRAVLTCSGCQNLPIAQDEASVAVHGSQVVVSFNDMRSRCSAITRQNMGYSSDGGATFTDNNGVPKDAGGGNAWGDASAAVNHKSGEFYVAGLYQIPNGIGGFRGHFAGANFVTDGGRATAVSSPDDFYDKPWMAVDSLSGNVYFTWSNFSGAGPVYLDFVRCDANLNPLGPVQILNDTTITWGIQFSQIAVGPGGVLYAIYQQYFLPPTTLVDDPVAVAIRRSSDFGATWGPITYVAPPHAVNEGSGGPGFLRGFASLQPTIAVDNSNGPHRGRVYVAWDSSIDYFSAPLLDTTTKIEVEPDDTPATATPFVPGGKLRGIKSGFEEDWFSFPLSAGDTYYQSTVFNWAVPWDSTREGVAAQIYAPDLSGTLHLAVNGTGTSGSLLYTAPRTATYYLRLWTGVNTVTPYVFYTLVMPAGSASGPARDSRDQVCAWSDDGIHWSDPVRMNDSAPGFDAQYPSIGVDGRGRVHCSWMDWRDDPESGTASTQYMASSGDGGVTWGPNQRIGDAVHGWSAAVCQSNGNTQGDYQMMAVDGDRVVTAFTDARNGDPDVIVDASVFAESASAPTAFVAEAGHDTAFAMRLYNHGNFGRALAWRLEDGAGWLAGTTSGSPTLAAGDSFAVAVSLHPTGGSGDSTRLRLIASDAAIPGFADTVFTNVYLTQPLSAPPLRPVAFFLAPPGPNPSRGPTQVRFGTERDGRVQVAVFSVDGARVRTLLDAPLGPGPHDARWDGRDALGRPVRAGSYLLRLTADGRSLSRRLVVTP